MSGFKSRQADARWADSFGYKQASTRLGRSSFLNLGGFQKTRDLFSDIFTGQLKDAHGRSSEGRTRSAASGGTGSENARESAAKYAGGRLAEPPTPPNAPTAYIDPRSRVTQPRYTGDFAKELSRLPYYDQWYTAATNAGTTKASERIRSEAIGYLTTVLQGSPILSPSSYGKLLNEGNAKYKQEFDIWTPLNEQYQADLKTSQEYNKGYDENSAAREVSSEMATEQAAVSGKQARGGLGEGVGQGATNTSPNLSFIKRNDTIWL